MPRSGARRQKEYHYVAFLRGINLGKRRISMEILRREVEKLPVRDVATFIASGNVLFTSPESDAHHLEELLAKHLEKSLGYSVDTAIRTRAELQEIAAHPYPTKSVKPGFVLHVAFHAQKLSPSVAAALESCRTAYDEFFVEGREVYWLCRGPSHESKVWSSPSVRALRLPVATMRSITTVRKMAELFPPSVG